MASNISEFITRSEFFLKQMKVRSNNKLKTKIQLGDHVTIRNHIYKYYRCISLCPFTLLLENSDIKITLNQKEVNLAKQTSLNVGDCYWYIETKSKNFGSEI